MTTPEPWLRGTLTEVSPVCRAVIHALQLAEEDVVRWCGDLSDSEINALPAGLPSVAFHIRHMAGSIDRLLAYAEGNALSQEQFEALRSESAPEARTADLLETLRATLRKAEVRIRKLQPEALESPRFVGKQRLPTTVGGLLVHVADHTQRHVGQAITTAKVVKSHRS